jgi:hypothetical protein
MHTILQYSPGQVATVTISVFDSDDVLADGYSVPSITKIIMPNLASASGFPVDMTKISTGIYQYKFQLPSGASAVGSYVVVVSYTTPTEDSKNEVIELQVNAPFANFSVSPG